MKSLREIFWDLPKHADKWDPYFDVYETWFNKFRGKSPRILEIGMQHGGSALMWLEYFGPGTKVVGIDIDPRCSQHATDDITVVIGDQSKEEFWRDFWSKNTEPFDIIIDDGSHYQADMILTYVIGQDQVKPDGIYLVEDCHTSYYDNHTVADRARDPDTGIGNPKNFIEFSKVSIDILNKKHLSQTLPQDFLFIHRSCKAVHFYDSVVVFEIGQPKPFTRCLNSGRMME